MCTLLGFLKIAFRQELIKVDAGEAQDPSRKMRREMIRNTLSQ